MKRIKLSLEAKCSEGKFCFPLNGKTETKKKWIDENDLFTNPDGKVFALVDTLREVYFMDAITGSLYQFGDCLTASKLKIDSLKRDHASASAILMRKKSDTLTVTDGLHQED